MVDSIINAINSQLASIQFIAILLNAIIHIIFAGAVARDAGALYNRGCPTIMVSGVTWSFATLIGGVIIATIYWILHHSTITRQKAS
jgi:hypothetical protein